MKLLVANRGEIAIRIFETCRKMGMTTAAFATEDDRNSPHILQADEVYFLEGKSLHETYLNAEKIIQTAKKHSADLIHPGYGFLSENASFARMVIENKMAWVGPSPEVISKMGSKIESKMLAEKINAPTLPWKYFKDSSRITLSAWKKEAKKIGYPILIKASSGGGGRGLRMIREESEIDSGIQSVLREVKASFGEGAVFMEKHLKAARHIEVQIFGDLYGNIITLGNRECSIQRRHQKIIEEAPAPCLSNKLEKLLEADALKLAQVLGYTNAGTVEFLVDENENHYFLEMNTRLQVEHAVTEWITGIDLVEHQIKTALGDKLSLKTPSAFWGHALECRIYAEDPFNSFIPTPGPVHIARWPTTRNTRVDAGLHEGEMISKNYDPLVGKITTWGKNREEACLQMLEALNQTTLLGFTHNIYFLKSLLQTEEFKNSKITTGFIEKEGTSSLQREPTKEQIKELVCSLLTQQPSKRKDREQGSSHLFSMIKI